MVIIQNPHALKSVRKAIGLEQIPFAQLLGISLSFYQKIETRARATPPEILARAHLLTGCDLDLFSDDGVSPTHQGAPLTPELFEQYTRLRTGNERWIKQRIRQLTTDLCSRGITLADQDPAASLRLLEDLIALLRQR